MTRQYTDMNQHDALYKAAMEYPGGIEALAQRLGMSSNVLRSKLAPGVKTHHVTFEEVSRIVEFLLDAKVDLALLPLHALAWRHSLVVFPLPSVAEFSDDQMADGLLNVTRELGEVVAVMQNVMADGKITLAERDRVEVEMQQLLAAGALLRERFLAKYQAQAAVLREVA